ncbi:hypothetical protein MF406_17810 [Georgenia sp. TF02-10]|uniref:helix-turn-helix transcriptional regulator n=1 Tax=Georgenia sp. TF02-10 TaxID=2917725 RepID=UPI001FA769E2|nr:helix-turn-helix domain-containing protein [Georgenia sp. TF02-10]UNX54705.1 hypothetical protein MF406_17810 [Georgenia sp. TF02-10]
MFEPLGLDDRAVEVYLALLAAPGIPLERLAARTSTDPLELHRYLQLLEEKQLLRRSHTDPRELRTESPEVAFERLVGRREAELHRTQEALSAARARAAELIEQYHRTIQNTRLGQIEHIVDTDAIVARLLELSQNAARNIDSMLTKAPTRHMLDQAKVDEGIVAARGVRVRSLFPAAARHADGVMEYAEWLTRQGGAARTVPSIPNRVLVYDGEVAVVMFDPANPDQGAIVLSAPGAVASLHAMFRLLWDTGIDLVAPQETELRPEERELLRLLARGMKDEAAARMLGLSIRTVRRLLTTLSERLDAPSRFTLGVRAAERGWL